MAAPASLASRLPPCGVCLGEGYILQAGDLEYIAVDHQGGFYQPMVDALPCPVTGCPHHARERAAWNQPQPFVGF